MTICNRMTRSRVSLAQLDDDDFAHCADDRAKVRRITRAMQRGAVVPAIFVIRLRGELLLIQGTEQTAAADRLGVEELDAIVFNATSDSEADQVGAVGFGLAESGADVWAGLRAYGTLLAA